ncbi:CGNR zinc finger domain-containing protein [Rhodococcus sp. BP-252]|uniref:CGNR zinc finger domain-containing protein n=1 Tax=unclassified Rhodococcus (in: high G+C Gram-positive bacteria) TaxID=192944 RepID=UPI001C9A7A66|nr:MULTISPECIES: CGNR zinc finger domain-containing protein [unclassified Rhodococcus (in: high G+C Gram-positive bacteria)]MBY6414519.1 CGNR zinc finger domain-containing protein [Rhodococcus sp. BP-320]MBY6419572.1 CGNR zinc finger domain-containing protein [Rhodococcus sp. BP-321]MBY6424186.1 CGNR zinc finger domain-containing protein [Rhodococcus sp. BP-324]MBY6429521.1 CGNR zinc finger domain-containing protein [Rhodococcus sp. BP-323]MBY6434414.1 CGNR zinc finger domain-containing protei
MPEADLRISLARNGTVEVHAFPDGSIAALTGVVMMAVFAAQQSREWSRMKLCRNPRCAVAFWDRSRNTSAAWHDVRTCGNVENLRKSRARRAPSNPAHK